jgi:Transcription-silencing protein, cryptic loci regulator Clr2
MDANQPAAADNIQWKKHLPYLYSITLPNIDVRQSVHDNESTKNTNLLLITRSDGIHKIGFLPNEIKDSRLGDGTAARQAYLCKVGSLLAAKAGISSGGNKATDAEWDALPEVLFGYEVFERFRDRVVGNKASDLYVVGHPIESTVEGLFRTAEEFAQHLFWLAEGNEEKDCSCVMCTKEAKRRMKQAASEDADDAAEEWRRECDGRVKSYLDSTTLGSFWGDLPELGE